MKKRVVALCVCFNELQYFLKSVVSSLWDAVDHIVIADGSPFGSSTDGTIEWLESLDNYKVTYVTGKYSNLWEQKNIAMKLGLELNPDYFLTCDSDEIFKKDDLEEILSYINVPNSPSVVMYKMYHTWKDLNHYQVGGPYSNPFIRLFKNVEGIRYDPPPAGDEPRDKAGRYLKMDEFYVKDTIFLAVPKVFHVGHSKTIVNEFLKVMRYAKWESASLEQALKRIELNGWFNETNPEPTLSVVLPESILKFKDPCEGCPKTRNLIAYCYNDCPVAKEKNFKYEKCMYDGIEEKIKQVLEKVGIKQVDGFKRA